MTSIRTAARIFIAILREIFDEAAYARFLDRAQVESSRQSYADFCREKYRSRERRPRCC